MVKEHMKTSVIMLAHDINEQLAQLTRDAVNSLEATENLGDREYIFIDNASLFNGGLMRSVADLYVRNKVNLGYPAAVNQGFKLSSGDLIAVANNDIVVSPNWLTVAKEIFDDNENVGSVHFRMINYGDPMTLGTNTWIVGRERWCTSSFFVLRRKAMVLYDEGYKEGGYDDWDFWNTVRHVNGWKTAYTTRACYQHHHSATYKALDDGKSRAERDARNRERFKEKFGAYAEDIWSDKYPIQMKEDYYKFLQQL